MTSQPLQIHREQDAPVKNGHNKKKSAAHDQLGHLLNGLDPSRIMQVFKILDTAQKAIPPNDNKPPNQTSPGDGGGNGGGNKSYNEIRSGILCTIVGVVVLIGDSGIRSLRGPPETQPIVDQIKMAEVNLKGEIGKVEQQIVGIEQQMDLAIKRVDGLEGNVRKVIKKQKLADEALRDYVTSTSEWNDIPDSMRDYIRRAKDDKIDDEARDEIELEREKNQ